MHVHKKGLRALGIAESFADRESSTLAGVVMRRDLHIDGIALARITVGGGDATEGVLEIVENLDRRDVNVLMLSGGVIAWYNIIDAEAIRDRTGLPVLMVTYEASEGLEDDILRHFPQDEARLEAYRRLGTRIPFLLPTGYTVFLRAWGMEESEATTLCEAFTHEGRVPEPLRVARLVARSVTRLGASTGRNSP